MEAGRAKNRRLHCGQSRERCMVSSAHTLGGCMAGRVLFPPDLDNHLLKTTYDSSWAKVAEIGHSITSAQAQCRGCSCFLECQYCGSMAIGGCSHRRSLRGSRCWTAPSSVTAAQLDEAKAPASALAKGDGHLETASVHAAVACLTGCSHDAHSFWRPCSHHWERGRYRGRSRRIRACCVYRYRTRGALLG